MVYEIKWYGANQQGTAEATAEQLTIVMNYLQLMHNATKFDISTNNSDDDFDQAVKDFNEFIEDLTFDDDDEDDDIVEKTVKALEEEARSELKAFYAKLIQESFHKILLNERKYDLKTCQFVISPVTAIHMSDININRILQEISSNCDNHKAMITLPNGRTLSFKKFTGSRDNGYQIGLVYIQVDNGQETKVRSYRTTIDWLEQMKQKPITELVNLRF